MNDVSITECSVMRGRVHKHGYGHKQATAAPSVAGVSEAGDCGGNIAAGLVGIAGGAALRRERQSGFRLATALSGRCGGIGRASLAAGDSDAGSSEGDGTGRFDKSITPDGIYKLVRAYSAALGLAPSTCAAKVEAIR